MPTPSRDEIVRSPVAAEPARPPARHPARPVGSTADRAPVVSAPEGARHAPPWRRVLVGLAMLLSGVAHGGLAPAADQILFGPVTYTRTSGPPTEVLETIARPPTLTAPFRLQIQNGDPDGSHRLSSATITLNGTPVAGPADFTPGVAGVERSVTLQPANTLQLRLTSPPGAFLVLTLTGTVPPPTLRSLEPPTLPLTQGGSGTLTATISPAQATDTLVLLTSSASDIAAVPAVVVVPAGAE